MDDFIQQRHQPPTKLAVPRELVVVCPPMRSNINVSRIARAAGCCGVRRMICCGTARLLAKIARDSREAIELEVHRTLLPVLARLRAEGYQLVGLEQTSLSESLFTFPFRRRTALVVGNERTGIEPEVLKAWTGPWRSRSTVAPIATTWPPQPRSRCMNTAASTQAGDRREWDGGSPRRIAAGDAGDWPFLTVLPASG